MGDSQNQQAPNQQGSTTETTPPAPDAAKNTGEGGNKGTVETVPYERFQQVNSKMRELEQQLVEFQKAQADAEAARQAEADQKLKEQQNWQKLYEEREKQLTEAKPILDQFNQMKQDLAKRNADRLKALPEHQQKQLEILGVTDPFKVDAWLNEAEKESQRRTPPPDFDSNKRSDGKPNVSHFENLPKRRL